MKIFTLFYMIGAISGIKIHGIAQAKEGAPLSQEQIQGYISLGEHLGLTVSEEMMVGQTCEDVSNAIIGAALETGKSLAEIEAVM